ncbi:Rieske (2Fe-2S) protein [Paenibacillus flagellatus]|uniref:(2Fe-2S)-binding protein n=1 Tax=Paenibacillus flagellatus TaxID=2211139 RepID=A0A2V5JWR6_9BACL|nr:Rieske 2Fe-2S domain-containing protein [Paenibacillus flagellatus]PYI51051.1 (2Fe-2S)-binding protein [Paenibacillus flagellatus]
MVDGWIKAGTVEELRREGAKVIKGGIAVFAREEGVFALDNRCPHMGFPLHMGSLCDGMLTCHWHHARFDVCTGGTLDLWADDVPAHEVKLEGDVVWVNPKPARAGGAERHVRRLREGLEQNLSLVIAKSVVALLEAGVPERDIVRIGVEFGTANRSDGWGSGLTVLTAMANVLPKLDGYGRMLALFHGLRRVASDCAGRPPLFRPEPLPDGGRDPARLAAWYRQCVEVRDATGAGRVLLTAIRQGFEPPALAEMMLAAATDHFYLDGGHTFDFHNKAFEMIELLGGDAADTERILTSLVPLLRNPSRSEESHSWRHPVDLVEPVRRAIGELERHGIGVGGAVTASATATAAAGQPYGFDAERFVSLLLGDEPLETIRAMTEALLGGVPPAALGKLTAYAAAERVSRFHTQNEFSDWIGVLHTFTHAHAVHVRLRQGGSGPEVRALYHAAVAIYLDRFLNIPPAPKPKPEQYGGRGYTTDTGELLALLDRRQQVAEAADWASHYMDAGGDAAKLFNALGHALLREDADFHTFQMVEAALAEYDLWAEEDDGPPLRERAKRTMVLALVRYVAAHAPTAREIPHTARIAWRLQRGEKLFEEE